MFLGSCRGCPETESPSRKSKDRARKTGVWLPFCLSGDLRHCSASLSSGRRLRSFRFRSIRQWLSNLAGRWCWRPPACFAGRWNPWRRWKCLAMLSLSALASSTAPRLPRSRAKRRQPPTRPAVLWLSMLLWLDVSFSFPLFFWRRQAPASPHQPTLRVGPRCPPREESTFRIPLSSSESTASPCQFFLGPESRASPAFAEGPPTPPAGESWACLAPSRRFSTGNPFVFFCFYFLYLIEAFFVNEL